jgi:uncharacterized membrane protein YphA (DoxX/SURF4 family)
MKFDLVFSAVKVLLGGGFLLFGLNGFFHFIPVPPPSNERAKMFADLLASTKIMSVIQVFEILGGAMILSGRLAPLGLLLIGPIIIGILVFHLLLDVKNIAGILIFALNIAPEEMPDAKASVYVFASKFNLEFIFLLLIAFSNDSV